MAKLTLNATSINHTVSYNYGYLSTTFILNVSLYSNQKVLEIDDKYLFLNNKYLNYIGILSYSIYLWQEIFINDTSLMINHFPLNLLFIPLAALFSYYVIEKPFLKLKAKY